MGPGRAAPERAFDVDATRRQNGADEPEHGFDAGWGSTGKRVLSRRAKALHMECSPASRRASSPICPRGSSPRCAGRHPQDGCRMPALSFSTAIGDGPAAIASPVNIPFRCKAATGFARPSGSAAPDRRKAGRRRPAFRFVGREERLHRCVIHPALDHLRVGVEPFVDHFRQVAAVIIDLRHHLGLFGIGDRIDLDQPPGARVGVLE